MSAPELASTADCLRQVAEILVRGEHAFAFMASAMGMPTPELMHVPQEFVGLIAAWLDVHPEVDAQMHSFLTSVDSAR